MGNFFDELNAEEQEFFAEQHEAKKSEANYSRQKANFFRWPAPNDNMSQYMGFLHIPKEKAEKFGGSIALPKVYRCHRRINVSEKFMKPGQVNLFPNSKRYNIRCTGDDSCLVCKKVRKAMEDCESLLNGNDLNKETRDLENKKLDSLKAMRAKNRRVWVGLEVTRNADRSFDKQFSIFDLSDYYWRASMQNFLSEKSEDFEDWCDANVDRLHGLSKAEIELIFIKEAAPARAMPWHPIKGFFVRINRSGKFGEYMWNIVDRNKFPYELFKIPAKAKGEAKKKYEKLLAAAKENLVWIKEQFEDGKVPSLDFFYKDLNADEQAEILGVQKNVIIPDVIEEELDIEETPAKMPEEIDLDDEVAEKKIEKIVDEELDDDDLDDLDDLDDIL